MPTTTGEPQRPRITFRLAKPSDAPALSELYYLCVQTQPGAAMKGFGRRFFRSYVRIILAETTSVVVCAEDPHGQIVGFAVGLLDPKHHKAYLTQHRVQLAFSLIGTLIADPGRFKDLVARARANAGGRIYPGADGTSCAHAAYWGWKPDYHAGGSSIQLIRTLFQVIADLGADALRLEVYSENRKVEFVQRMLGARTIGRYISDDGVPHILMEHDLRRWRQRHAAPPSPARSTD